MKDKLRKYLLPNLPYLFFVYLFDKLCQAVRLAPGLDTSEKLLHIGQGFQTAFASSAPSFHALDICVGSLLSIYLLILSINLLIYELLCYFSFFSLMFSPNADCTRAEIVTLKNLIF